MQLLMDMLNEWTRGWHGLVIIWALAAVMFYITLWRSRVGWAAYLFALPFTALAAIGSIVVVAVVDGILEWKFGPPKHTLASFMTGMLNLALVMACGVIAAKWLIGRRLGGPDRHVRGTHIVDGEAHQRFAKKIKRKTRGDVLSLAGVAVHFTDEPKHFKLIGVTGTGKSTAVAELMGAALERGDRAIFADPDGGYLDRFYNPGRGDLILNPFDSRSVMWDLFGEICQPYDIEGLAHSLIAEGEGSAREWRGYARVFLAEVIRYCYENNIHELPGLWRLLAVASNEELRPVVAGTPAQPFLEPEAARMFGSIRGVCASSISAFRYLKDSQGEKLSVRQWIQSGRGVLFLPYAAGQIAALASVIATWVRLGIFETMNRPEPAPGAGQPMWFVVDELDALGAIDGLKDALARLRKFDGRCVLGFLSIHRPGLEHLWREFCADDRGELR